VLIDCVQRQCQHMWLCRSHSVLRSTVWPTAGRQNTEDRYRRGWVAEGREGADLHKWQESVSFRTFCLLLRRMIEQLNNWTTVQLKTNQQLNNWIAEQPNNWIAEQLNNSTTQQLNNSTAKQPNSWTTQLNNWTAEQLNNPTTEQLNNQTTQQLNS